MDFEEAFNSIKVTMARDSGTSKLGQAFMQPCPLSQINRIFLNQFGFSQCVPLNHRTDDSKYSHFTSFFLNVLMHFLKPIRASSTLVKHLFAIQLLLFKES